MPVAEAMERVTEAEFLDWMFWFEWRAEIADKQARGLPLHDGDEAEEMTPEESIATITAFANQINARRSS